MAAADSGGSPAPVAEPESKEPPGLPAPEFEIARVEPVDRAAAPTLRFQVRASDSSGRRVYLIALSVVITVEPAKRSYDAEARLRLVELFGPPERWAATTQSFRWTQAEALVPSFVGATAFDLVVPCTYDHDVAASKYFHGLADGNVPLRFHFSGTVYYETPEGALQLVRVPWDRSVRFSMGVDTWSRMISRHYPHRGWIALHADTIDRLGRFKAERGLPTFDSCLERLLDAEEG